MGPHSKSLWPTCHANHTLSASCSRLRRATPETVQSASCAHTFSFSRGRSSSQKFELQASRSQLALHGMAASALQPERHLLLLAGGSGGGHHRPLLRMLPPRAPLPHRRRRWPRAVRVSSSDGGGGGGERFASAVEKHSIPGAVGEDHGARARVEEELEGETAGALELRWPPWEGLGERYKLIGASSLAFVICNMDKVTHLFYVSRVMNHDLIWTLRGIYSSAEGHYFNSLYLYLLNDTCHI